MNDRSFRIEGLTLNRRHVAWFAVRRDNDGGRVRRSVQTLTVWFAAACCAAIVTPLAAQDIGFVGRVSQPAEHEDGARFRTAAQSAAAGTFLRLAESPTTSTHRVSVSTHGGYDGSRRGTVLEARGDAVLFARTGLERRSKVGLALVGGASYGLNNSATPNFSSARAGLKLQPVFQQQHGVDAALAVSYDSRGFNLVPAVSAELLLARSFGETQLVLNVGYGAGLRESEHAGRLRAAVLTRLVADLRVGLEARGQLDLERDDDEPSGENDFEVAASAVANYTISHISLTAGAGPGAIRYRDGRETQVGLVATFGVGATL